MKKYLLLVVFGVLMGGCASITNDSYVPVALSFSDGSKGECDLENKRYAKTVDIPGTADVRRSDDNLKYRCKSNNGKKAFGSIPSKMGGKIVASAVFLDFGIVDSITDKHREYPASFVIPIR